jgi:methyl-accepting chemotaxis protein
MYNELYLSVDNPRKGISVFKWVSNTPIFLRLLLGFASAAIIPAITTVTLMVAYSQLLDTAGNAVQTSNQAIKVTTTELAHLQSMHALLVALLPGISTDNSSDQAGSQTEQNTILSVLSIEKSFDVNTVNYQRQYQLATTSSMADMRAILLSNDNSAVIARQQRLLDTVLKQQWPQYKAAQDNLLVGLYAQISLDQAASLLQQADALYTPLLASWQEVVTIAEQVNTEAVRANSSQTNPILLGTVLAILGSIIIVFVIVSLLNQTITKPLHHLVGLTRRIMQGETTARANLTGHDEIAWVGQSMNMMLDNIVQLMQETRSKRDELQLQVEELISAVRGVAKGDLRLRADVRDNSLGVLASCSNSMIDELESLVMRIQKVAHEVEIVTMRILEQMAQPIKIGNLQIQQVVEATISIEQVTSVSYEAADHAQKLQAVADSAERSAAEGHQAVWRTMDEISKIRDNVQVTARKVQTLGERSEEIKNIAEVISTIAYQTNRLALDSAVQAALAGENGGGFGAVAVNIRRLAEQTKSHASLITRIVRSVREDISTATASMLHTEHETLQEAALIQDVGEALNVIFTGVERQTQEISTINEMATQHWQSANRIVQIMPQISNATQHNNRSIVMSSQHIQRLYQQVELLRISVGAFKVHNDQDRSVSTPSNPFHDRSSYANAALAPRVSNSGSFSNVTLPPSIRPRKSVLDRIVGQ